MKNTLSLIALVAAMPAFAEGTRQLDSHEHGVGTLDIAIDGNIVAMEFHAPGADIVGFEYVAKSDADHAAIDAAVARLGAPLDLFVVPDAAGCSATEAMAELESEEGHSDHDHDDHAHSDHEDHDEEDHDDHEAHDHDGHEEHSDEDHAEHSEDAGHSEFHAEYTLTCEKPDALDEITFAYFDAFANAKEVEVRLISAAGAEAFEVTRDEPVLDLER